MYLIKISFATSQDDTPLTVDLLDQLLEASYPTMLEILSKNIANDVLQRDHLVDLDNVMFYMVFDSPNKRQVGRAEIQPWIQHAGLLLHNNQISITLEFLEIEDHLSLGQIETESFK